MPLRDSDGSLERATLPPDKRRVRPLPEYAFPVKAR